MPKLIIDNREIEVPDGTKVIEAAERLGIMIPRFCYHPALGSVGACRVCAVKFLEGPVKGVEMSCMEDAQDGMVVSTSDPEVMEFRKYVIEWLMLHHPLDCPVCDEGGHCLLQDETVSGGHGLRRYLGKKRTYRDQDLGVFVQHEMNRCIHCFRCRRFYQDFAGYRDLGAMQIGNRMYFGRFHDGPLESPFSGNLIDVCPTGVYTDKPARFKGRRWDFERGPSICLHCSLGCNTIASTRYREMVRQEAGLSESVNGHFICDRGRFGFAYTNLPDRPRRARVGEKEVSWQEGVQAAAKALNRIIQSSGPNALFCLGSTRSSLETQGTLKRFCRIQGLPDPRYFLEPEKANKTKAAVGRLDERLAVSMREVEEADFILAVGADPINEAPMLALAMRQAHRKGASVAVIDPRPISLPFEFEHLAVAPGKLELCLSVLVKGAVPRGAAEKLGSTALRFFDALPGKYADDAHLQDRLTDLAQEMQKRQRPVLICGTDIVRGTTPELAARHALLISTLSQRAGLFYLFSGPNAFGAALLSPAQEQPLLVEGIESGDIKGLLLVENDPFWLYPDQERLSKAFDKLELLIVMDYLPSESLKRGHIVLPTTTLFEGGASSFVNQEGRLQVANSIQRGGFPVSQVGEAKHPPRTFLDHIPGGEPKPAHDALGDLAAAVSGNGQKLSGEKLWAWMALENPVFGRIVSSSGRANGLRLIPEKRSEDDFASAQTSRREEEKNSQDHLELLLVEWTFGTEELSCHSKFIQQVEITPQLTMHRKDAERLGFSHGNDVSLNLDGSRLKLQLNVSENIAPGVMVLPRHRQLAWQKLKNRRGLIPMSSIERL